MLKQLRKKYALKQYELGRLLGVTPNFICMIEKGHRGLPPWMFAEIQKIFGMQNL